MINKAIVLANGLFPKRKEALQALLQAPLLVCCDGAYDKLVASTLFSHATTHPEVYVVGDGDSLKAHSAETTPPYVHYVEGYTDQDTNDLSKAVRFALTKEVTHLLILGATGLREDHTLGNISLLAQYCNMHTSSGKPLQVRMYTDYGYFSPVHVASPDPLHENNMPPHPAVTLPSFAHQQVSLFALGDIEVTSVGLKYPLHHRRLNEWWEATLNEAEGNNFTLEVSGNGTLLVYQTHDPKL